MAGHSQHDDGIPRNVLAVSSNACITTPKTIFCRTKTSSNCSAWRNVRRQDPGEDRRYGNRDALLFIPRTRYFRVGL